MRLRTVAFAAAVISLIALTVAPFGGTDDHVPRELTAAGASYAGLNTITPERLLDTRIGIGAPVGPVGEGQTLTVPIAGHGSVPSDASTVLMNVTVDAPTLGGYLTVYPAGGSVPATSNINMPAGKTVPNLVAVRLGGGAVSFYNAFGTTHVLADVTAYAREDGNFVGVAPARLLDTRVGLGASGPVGPAASLDLDVLGRFGVPTSGVAAVVLNVTADQPTEPSFITVWPTGVAMPNASSLNIRTGQTVANLVFAPVGAGGRVSFFNERGKTHLLADVAGYVPVGAAYVPLVPTRVMDTRIGLGWGAMVGPDRDAVLDLSDRFPAAIDVGGVVLNVTAAGPTERSFITVYPGDATLPNASNLNIVAGEDVPNAVVVRLGPGGEVLIHNERGATHLVVDLVGLIPRRQSVGGSGEPSAAPPSTTPTSPSAVRCVIGAPGGGGSTDLATGFGAGRGYDLDPWFTTKGLPGDPGISDLRLAAAGCDLVIVHGYSEGGRLAKEWYCSGETLGGRMVGYVLDDPSYLPDEGVPCTPAAGVRVALYATRMSPTDDRWTIDYYLSGNGYGATVDKTAARIGAPIQVSPRYLHIPYTQPSPPEILRGGWW